jgi:hypothetical protein
LRVPRSEVAEGAEVESFPGALLETSAASLTRPLDGRLDGAIVGEDRSESPIVSSASALSGLASGRFREVFASSKIEVRAAS